MRDWVVVIVTVLIIWYLSTRPVDAHAHAHAQTPEDMHDRTLSSARLNARYGNGNDFYLWAPQSWRPCEQRIQYAHDHNQIKVMYDVMYYPSSWYGSPYPKFPPSHGNAHVAADPSKYYGDYRIFPGDVYNGGNGRGNGDMGSACSMPYGKCDDENGCS